MSTDGADPCDRIAPVMPQRQDLIHTRIVIGNMEFESDLPAQDVKASLAQWFTILGGLGGGNSAADQNKIRQMAERLKTANDKLADNVKDATPE